MFPYIFNKSMNYLLRQVPNSHGRQCPSGVNCQNIQIGLDLRCLGHYNVLNKSTERYVWPIIGRWRRASAIIMTCDGREERTLVKRGIHMYISYIIYMLCCGPVKVPGIMILTHSGANLKVAHMAGKRGEGKGKAVRWTGWVHKY